MPRARLASCSHLGGRGNHERWSRWTYQKCRHLVGFELLLCYQKLMQTEALVARSIGWRPLPVHQTARGCHALPPILDSMCCQATKRAHAHVHAHYWLGDYRHRSQSKLRLCSHRRRDQRCPPYSKDAMFYEHLSTMPASWLTGKHCDCLGCFHHRQRPS